MNPRLSVLVAATATLVLTTACPSALQAAGAVDTVQIEGAYVRAVPPGQPNSAAFLELTNADAADHALVAAESDACAVVELHTHRLEDGLMRMRRIDQIALPAGTRVVLEPGGLHIMLIGLREPLATGDRVALELVFDDGSRTRLSAPVRRIEPTMAPGRQHD